MSTKWKYKIIKPKFPTFAKAEAKIEQQDEILNRAGMEGWNLVSVSKTDHDMSPTFYFKRPH